MSSVTCGCPTLAWCHPSPPPHLSACPQPIHPSSPLITPSLWWCEHHHLLLRLILPALLLPISCSYLIITRWQGLIVVAPGTSHSASFRLQSETHISWPNHPLDVNHAIMSAALLIKCRSLTLHPMSAAPLIKCRYHTLHPLSAAPLIKCRSLTLHLHVFYTPHQV